MGRQDAIACTFCRCLFFAERAKHRVGKSGSFQGFQKFHPHQMKLPRRLLPAHPRLNWRCLWREAAGRCWRWGGDGQLEHAIIPQHSCTHEKCARSADVQRLGEVDELRAACLLPPDEQGDLQAKARRATPFCGDQWHSVSSPTAWPHPNCQYFRTSTPIREHTGFHFHRRCGACINS